MQRPQLVSKFSAFYGNRKFITEFTRAFHSSLLWKNSVHALLPHFFEIRFNTILPSNTRSSKFSPSYGFPIKILHAFLSSLFVSHTLPIRLKKAFTVANDLLQQNQYYSLSFSVATNKTTSSPKYLWVFYENCRALFTCPQPDGQMKRLLTSRQRHSEKRADAWNRMQQTRDWCSVIVCFMPFALRYVLIIRLCFY